MSSTNKLTPLSNASEYGLKNRQEKDRTSEVEFLPRANDAGKVSYRDEVNREVFLLFFGEALFSVPQFSDLNDSPFTLSLSPSVSV